MSRFLATVRDDRWCVVDSYSDDWVVAIATHNITSDMEWAIEHAKALSESYAEIENAER